MTGMREFETGATRNLEVDPDYHGFFSPLAMHAYGEYMHAHRLQADGTLRDSDNWQRGMPLDAYVRSLVRHTHDVQLIHDGYEALARSDDRDPSKMKAHLAAIIFNAQGLLHEIVQAEQGHVVGHKIEVTPESRRVLQIGDRVRIKNGLRACSPSLEGRTGVVEDIGATHPPSISVRIGDKQAFFFESEVERC